MNTPAAKHVETPSVESLVSRLADEFLNRLNRGEQPDVEEYARQHPELATILRGVLATVQVMGTLPLDAPSASDPLAHQPPVAGCLGDYRILRQIGRGGMGVVYEAEQISLGRRVALKVLPLAAVLDSKQLQRFKHEAQTAAQLHHTNIVPVFSVGCERGVHYYAMQYIEGQTLAEVIRELRRSAGLEAKIENGGSRIEDRDANDAAVHGLQSSILDPRSSTHLAAALSTEGSNRSPAFFHTVASLGVQAAGALEHAHALGVVHRDIKPSNLLVDTRGNLWVTDFGLARFHQDAELTMTGDLIGTVRYMSPEQARGQRTALDHRTDIYSLGASLYELLTLTPAFQGQDRHELLSRIASQEPVPPRRLNPAIPAELETILLKAMAKTADERYPTAQEFADDLERFIEDKPIVAKRPSLRQRLARWSRRHKAVVVTAGIAGVLLLLLAVVGLAVSNVLIKHERDEKDAALRDKDDALATAETNLAAAEAQRKRAQTNFTKATKAINVMLTNVAQTQFTRDEKMELVRREVLQQALKLYQEFLQPEETELAAREETARAHLQLVTIYDLLDQPDAAEDAGRQAQDLYEKLAGEFPSDPAYQNGMAAVHAVLGVRLAKTAGRQKEAEQHLRAAIDLWNKPDRAPTAEPASRIALAQTCHRLGYLLWFTFRQSDEAEQLFRRAIAIQKQLATEFPIVLGYERALAGSYNSYGIMLRMTNRPREAEQAFRDAVQIFDELATDPRGGDNRDEMARSLFHLALVLRQTGNPQEADEAGRRALELQESVVAGYPLLPGPRQNLAGMCAGFGEIRAANGRLEEAEQFYRQALAIQGKLLAEFPNFPDVRGQLANSFYRLANLLRVTDRSQQAAEMYGRLLEIDPDSAAALNDLAWCLATCPDAQFRNPSRAVELARKATELTLQTGESWNTLGVALYRAGEWSEAIAALDKSRQLLSHKLDSFNTFFLAMAHWQLGDNEAARSWFDQAVEWMEKNNPKNDELRRFRAEAAELLHDEPGVRNHESDAGAASCPLSPDS